MTQVDGEKAKAGVARGFGRVFGGGALTIGLFFPIEAFRGDTPCMTGQEELAVRAERLGFASLWFRDVPLRVPAFGDVGQVYDPFVYVAWIAARTSEIALSTGAIVLPLHHPLHVAKAAASLDVLTNGRLLLGVASGDRAEEYPAFGVPFEDRGDAFRDALAMVGAALRPAFPIHASERYGVLDGSLDTIPKPTGRIPVLAVGSSRQELGWLAANVDAFISYPRHPDAQRALVTELSSSQPGAEPFPFGQSLYVDLSADPDEVPTPIHLGFRTGRRFLVQHLRELQAAGVRHVALNLKYGRRLACEVVDELGTHVVPEFPVRAPNGAAVATHPPVQQGEPS